MSSTGPVPGRGQAPVYQVSVGAETEQIYKMQQVSKVHCPFKIVVRMEMYEEHADKEGKNTKQGTEKCVVDKRTKQGHFQAILPRNNL